MKIINLSLLFKLISIKKNAKKFLVSINIGIFLSIFAISATIITFYTEAKIDQLEFDLQIERKYRKESADFSLVISNIRNLYFLSLKSNEDLISLYENNSYSKLGQKTITIDDIYLPTIVTGPIHTDKKVFQLFFAENGLMEVFEKKFLETYEKDTWMVKDMYEVTKALKSYRNLLSKDNSNLIDRVFNYDLAYLDSQINNENVISYYDDPIYLEYIEVQNFFKEFKKFFYLMEIYTIDIASLEQESIKDLNKEILELSNKESKIIIFAFIFQLMVFFIIQFFEISSIQKEFKNYAKRKIK